MAVDYQTQYRYRQFVVPSYMMGGIERWIEEGIEPGDFLTGIIKNDLKQACAHADDHNLANLPAYVALFYNGAPGDCWGSEDNFQRWQRLGGLKGLRAMMDRRKKEAEQKKPNALA